MIQLSDEGQRLLRIIIFVAIAVGMIALYLIFAFGNNSEPNSANSSDLNVQSQQSESLTPIPSPEPTSPEAIEEEPVPAETFVEENPKFIEEFADLVEQRDDEAIEQEIAMYKSFIEKYIQDVNDWNYETDLETWSQDILNMYASDDSPAIDSISRVSETDMEFCRTIECFVMGAGEFFNEEVPSYGGDFSGYFSVSTLTTDREGSEDTIDTFWLVEAGMDEVGDIKILYVEDMQTDSIDIE